MTDKNIKHIIFDLGGVIILNKRVDFTKFDNKFLLPTGTVQAIIDECFRIAMRDSTFNVRQYLARRGRLTYGQYLEATKALFDTEYVNSDLVEWIISRKRFYTFSALTNNTAALKKLLKDRFAIAHVFDRVYNSAEIGLAKPDQRLFKYILTDLDTEPMSCLFVDDNIANTRAADELGFHSIHFARNEQFFKEVDKLHL